MSGHETALGYQWLYSTLSSDSTLAALAVGGCWRAMAPPTITTYPYVVFALQSAKDSVTMNAFRLLSEQLFQVKAVGPGSLSAAIAGAAQRIDQLLSSPSSGSTSGGVILSSYRESPFEVNELVNGELWWNLGGLYRLLIEQSS